MTFTTTAAPQAWRPDQYQFAPADAVPNALVLQCSWHGAEVEGDTPVVRTAFIRDDNATTTAEAQPITEAAPQLLETLVHVERVTQLVTLSMNQYRQTGTADQLSQSVARAVTRRADKLFVSDAYANGSGGLLSWPGTVNGGLVSGSLDALIDLIAVLESNLSNPSHVIVDPLGWAAFRKLKVAATYNQSLLGAGTSDVVERLLSIPVIVSPQMSPHSGLVIDHTAVVNACGPVYIGTSEHERFSSSQVVLKAEWSVGHSVTFPERIGKFTLNAGS